MSNPLYQEMMQNAGNNIPMQMLSQLRQNPIHFAVSRGFNVPTNVGNDVNSVVRYLMDTGQISQYAISRGFNVPMNVGNDPNAIIQHLMNTGQIPQYAYNQAMQTVRNIMG